MRTWRHGLDRSLRPQLSWQRQVMCHNPHQSCWPSPAFSSKTVTMRFWSENRHEVYTSPVDSTDYGWQSQLWELWVGLWAAACSIASCGGHKPRLLEILAVPSPQTSLQGVVVSSLSIEGGQLRYSATQFREGACTWRGLMWRFQSWGRHLDMSVSMLCECGEHMLLAIRKREALIPSVCEA